MQSLGADEVVNYRTDDFAELYKEPAKHLDAIIDVVGGKFNSSSDFKPLSLLKLQLGHLTKKQEVFAISAIDTGFLVTKG